MRLNQSYTGMSPCLWLQVDQEPQAELPVPSEALGGFVVQVAGGSSVLRSWPAQLIHPGTPFP